MAVVGAGIVGLAVARQLLRGNPAASVVVIEREDAVGSHQSGHNSGVIHSGLYYSPGSLKAELCVSGGRLLKSYCEEHSIPVGTCGKVVVAVDDAELARLQHLFERGLSNGVPGLHLVEGSALRELEPHVVGLRAIHSPSTAVVDFSAVSNALAEEVAASGQLWLGTEVMSVLPRSDGLVRLELAGGHAGHFDCDFAIVCAGLQSDRLAVRSGADAEPRIVPFRGSYYRLRPAARHLVRGLVYPVPDPRYPFLGIHLTRTVHDEVLVGPNAFLGFSRDNYARSAFAWQDVQRHLTWPGFPRFARSNWRAGVREISHDEPARLRLRGSPLRPGDHRRRLGAGRGRYPSPGDASRRVAGRRLLARLQGRRPRRAQCSFARRDGLARDRRLHLQAGRVELRRAQCRSVATAWPPGSHGRKGSCVPPGVASQRAQAARRPRCCRRRHRGIGLQQYAVGHFDDVVELSEQRGVHHKPPGRARHRKQHGSCSSDEDGAPPRGVAAVAALRQHVGRQRADDHHRRQRQPDLGAQTIVVSYRGAKATMIIELVGQEAYFRGDAAAIEVLINLTAPQSAAAAGQWVSVVPADSVYQSTAAALTVGSVMSELALSPPITGSELPSRVVEVSSRSPAPGSGEGITAKDHAAGELEVTEGVVSLPVAFSGVMPATASAARFVENLVVSKWGEAVHVVAPAFSVPLATILKSTTTTTPPVVV